MTPKASVVLAVVCFALGIGIGLRWSNNSKREQGAVQQITPKQDQTGRPFSKQSEFIEPSRAASRSALERIRAAIGPDGKINGTECFSAIAELNLGECREASRIVRKWRAPEKMFLTEAIARRWAELDANDALAAALKE